uniref:PHD-type domain-containing protein n=1 Tax=Panagrolaimus sp. PS1159 TaxID=55785 RepID=A0AC35G4R4_9BILA
MVVGIESWKDLRTSLMKDVHGFAPQSLSCRPQAVRRTNSLNSMQSLCSTNFSSDDDNNFSSGFLNNVPLPPDEDAEEDWRMFGWLLDSADASSSMSYTFSEDPCESSEDECKQRLYSPLPPLEIPSESFLPESSDLLKIKRKRIYANKPLGTFTDKINDYRNPQSRKRSISSGDEFDSEDEEDLFECRAMTRSAAHYLELKRRRKIGAPMLDEEFIVKQEPKIEVEENYVYEPIKEEYSMESESIDNSGIDITEQYIDTSVNSNIKTEILDSSSTSDHGRKGGGKVEVIRGIKGGNNGKRTKTGRPTNKEKRQIERETKKILKKQQKDLSHDLQRFCGTKTCYCQKIFDPAQDYIKCSTCSNLFHPKCAKISLSKAEKMNHWACKYCDPNETEPKEQDETATEEILCICNEPYDSNSHWIGCNLCDKWFHPECVQTTIEAVQAAGEYICHSCAFDRASQRETEEEPIQQNIDDGVYYA